MEESIEVEMGSELGRDCSTNQVGYIKADYMELSLIPKRRGTSFPDSEGAADKPLGQI